MDNTWHARGTGLCPSDPRFTMDLAKQHELQKLPVPTRAYRLVLFLFQYAEDILGGVGLGWLLGRWGW
mgnify:CR=1 FL=1